jgi:hypothetical protein
VAALAALLLLLLLSVYTIPPHTLTAISHILLVLHIQHNTIQHNTIQVFEAPDKYAGFIRPKNITVGDYPEKDLMAELEGSDDDEI